MESIITIVGFLGAGKTTLLKHLVESAVKNQWHPYVILNDYIDADLDAQQISNGLGSMSVKGLTGSCICCDGITELRECVNNIPARKAGITLIERIPSDILRINGCTKVGGLDGYTHFERCPDGEIYLRPYQGSPITGPKLLAVGPRSDPSVLRNAVEQSLGMEMDGVEPD